MRDKYCTAQHSIVEQVEELSLNIPAPFVDGLRSKETHFAKLCAADFSVKIEFSYTPAIAPRAWGHPDDYDDGAPAELSVTAIKAEANVHFDGDGVSLTATRGTDLLQLFAPAAIDRMEDRLMARAQAGAFE